MSRMAERFQCRHILAAGHRCGSPALRGEPLCYFPHTSRRPNPGNHERRSDFEFPPLEDRAALQLAIGEVLNRLARQQIDPKRAGLLLYGLQIAAQTLLPVQLSPAAADTVDELTESGLAPEQFLEVAPQEKSLEQILVEHWARDQQDSDSRRLASTLARVQATDARVGRAANAKKPCSGSRAFWIMPAIT